MSAVKSGDSPDDGCVSPDPLTTNLPDHHIGTTPKVHLEGTVGSSVLGGCHDVASVNSGCFGSVVRGPVSLSECS